MTPIRPFHDKHSVVGAEETVACNVLIHRARVPSLRGVHGRKLQNNGAFRRRPFERLNFSIERQEL